jgi:hypothetical protein
MQTHETQKIVHTPSKTPTTDQPSHRRSNQERRKSWRHARRSIRQELRRYSGIVVVVQS